MESKYIYANCILHFLFFSFSVLDSSFFLSVNLCKVILSSSQDQETESILGYVI